MDSAPKFTASGRKGELAETFDASGLLAGDHVVIDLGIGSVKITKLDEMEFRIEGTTDYFEAADGETYAQLGAGAISTASLKFKRKRNPITDLETAGRGEFTAGFSADDERDGGHSER